jgi:hypothetical protein
MPKIKLGDAPFPPVLKVDTARPIALEQLSEILLGRLKGVTICVRSDSGHESRGGYFFHLRPTSKSISECEIYNFEKILVTILPLEKTTAFVNHCAGLAFDEWSFQFCQSVVNFRLDPD